MKQWNLWAVFAILLLLLVAGVLLFLHLRLKSLEGQITAGQQATAAQIVAETQKLIRAHRDSVVRITQTIHSYEGNYQHDAESIQRNNDIDSLVALYRLHRASLRAGQW